MGAELEVSAQQEIQQLCMERPHVVILGAGASRAAFPAAACWTGAHLPRFDPITMQAGWAITTAPHQGRLVRDAAASLRRAMHDN